MPVKRTVSTTRRKKIIKEIDPVMENNIDVPISAPVETFTKNKVNSTSNKKLWWLWLIIFLVLLGGAFFLYKNYYLNQQKSNSQQFTGQQRIKEVLNKLGQLMVLPEGEEPMVATINDAKSLAKEQFFYKDAQNGDLLIVYLKAKKAIIYSPSLNKIVNAGPAFVQNNKQEESINSTTSTPTTTVEITSTTKQ